MMTMPTTRLLYLGRPTEDVRQSWHKTMDLLGSVSALPRDFGLHADELANIRARAQPSEQNALSKYNFLVIAQDVPISPITGEIAEVVDDSLMLYFVEKTHVGTIFDHGSASLTSIAYIAISAVVKAPLLCCAIETELATGVNKD